MKPYHVVETPTNGAGAIGMIRVVHPDPTQIGLKAPGLGGADGKHASGLILADLFGIDQGVIARWDQDSIMLMPHGGVAIVHAISSALTQRGVPIQTRSDPRATYPEARTEIEAWMLRALAQASSPLANEPILLASKRWTQIGIDRIEQANRDYGPTAPRTLDRLINPPIVAAVGRANVGKSTLVNALAKEQVAIVADVAGTTRDHIGVMIDLAGVVVRWIDTPGIDERIGDSDELDIACASVARADLIVHCLDVGDESGELDPRLQAVIGPEMPMIRVGTRADLGSHACRVDLVLGREESGSKSGSNHAQLSGIEELVGRVGEVLVPAEDRRSVLPWRFWDALGHD
ncbi:MAG: GTPase [Phycisphaerales bacterium]